MVSKIFRTRCIAFIVSFDIFIPKMQSFVVITIPKKMNVHIRPQIVDWAQET